MQFNERHTATILAALRYWQREGITSCGHEGSIACNGGDIEPLTGAEIDDLCEQINVPAATATASDNCQALLESVHEELEGMGFGSDDSIDGGDCCEYLGKLFVDVGEALERDGAKVAA